LDGGALLAVPPHRHLLRFKLTDGLVRLLLLGLQLVKLLLQRRDFLLRGVILLGRWRPAPGSRHAVKLLPRETRAIAALAGAVRDEM
jgi:hypothetical protein